MSATPPRALPLYDVNSWGVATSPPVSRARVVSIIVAPPAGPNKGPPPMSALSAPEKAKLADVLFQAIANDALAYDLACKAMRLVDAARAEGTAPQAEQIAEIANCSPAQAVNAELVEALRRVVWAFEPPATTLRHRKAALDNARRVFAAHTPIRP